MEKKIILKVQFLVNTILYAKKNKFSISKLLLR